MHIVNPILPGFHPDPSICRVGQGFYLVTSSFEYFPGLPIYYSEDLIHWEQIGHCLTRNSQVHLTMGAPNCLNIYAPTIRYHEGTFYVVVTCVNGDNHGNFIVTATDPAGPWSEPMPLPFSGIDPSLFFDTDGKVYYTGSDQGIYLWEMDIHTGQAIGEKHMLWNGTANNPEGPHLYHIGPWYYLLLAQGGTELCHMAAIARSTSVFGPYTPCPYNPILTNIGQYSPLKAVGHADLVDDPQGHWWAVALCNRPLGYPFRHNLGRETILVPVTWKDGWPYMGEHSAALPSFDVDADLPTYTPQGYIPGSPVVDTFQGTTPHLSWNVIYNPVEGLIHYTGNQLQLCGNDANLDDDRPKAWLGRRQEHFCCTAEMYFHFSPVQDGEEAGLTIYMNPHHHYEIARTRQDGQDRVILRRRIGSLCAVTNSVSCTAVDLVFQLSCDRDRYTFWYGTDVKELQPLGWGETQYLTTEVGGCFTGNYIAMYATGNGKRCQCNTEITKFVYTPLPEA